ncbi:hypothetical protein SARC_18073, partial [Sphaeroforma arctica JP610]
PADTDGITEKHSTSISDTNPIVEDLDFKYDPFGTATGSVINGLDDSPITGVKCLLQFVQPDGQVFSREVDSDDDGMLTMTGLVDGSYILSCPKELPEGDISSGPEDHDDLEE